MVVTGTGGPEKNHIAESTGTGVAVLDYDQDGLPDLYFPNAPTWNDPEGAWQARSGALYRNNGDTRFSDVTEAAGLVTDVYGQGAVSADFDGDGFPDLYVTVLGPNLFFRNNGDGTFAGGWADGWCRRLRGGASAPPFWTPTRDGLADLFVANYIEPVRTGHPDRRRAPDAGEGRVPVLDGPRGLAPQINRYFPSRGDGAFEDLTTTSGVADLPARYSMGVVALDFDDDGDQDIFVANDSGPNAMLENGGGVFRDAGLLTGVALSADGATQGSMAVAASDATADRFPDLGNWDAPAPGVTPWQQYALNDDGTLGDLLFATTVDELAQPDNLLAPRSYHYTAAYEREIGSNMSVGVQYVHKYTERMVGWSILGGAYETIEWADPYTGAPMNILSQTAQPTLVKGNSPGDFPGAPEKYEQTYDGVLFTFAIRDAGLWNVQGSYTYSKSTGLIPRPWSQSQQNPFYGSTTGQDPNAYLNLGSGQRLQGDRPHMFRLQGVLFLPWDLLLAANVNIESGKPFSRQVRASGISAQPANNIIVELAGSRPGLTQPQLNVVDIRFGKRLDIGDLILKLDAYVYNALNSTASIWMSDLLLETPGEAFIPSSWVEPRRLMLLAGFVF